MASYFTYIDVLERLRSPEALEYAPGGLRAAHPLPSRLVLSMDHNTPIEQVKNWLRQLFGPRYSTTDDRIILESASNGSFRSMPLDMERFDPDDIEEVGVRLRPTLMRGKGVAYHAKYSLPHVASLDGLPAVLTFHSFKGGMGRTTLALALANALAESKRRILFIDADFEAPGLSLLVKQDIPVPNVAFADLLALAYTDPTPDAGEAIEIVVERLRDQQLANIFVLPCTRNLELPELLPESLTLSQNRSAFFIGDLVARLGARLEVELVIIDLRAGLSELSAAMFLDPRLQHVLVTTLNGQSIDGTVMLLERMQDIAFKWQIASNTVTQTSLSVIVNQIPPGHLLPDSLQRPAHSALTQLDDELAKFTLSRGSVGSTENSGSSNPFFDRPVVPILVPQVPEVSILPRDLSAFRKALSGSILHSVMLENFADFLPIRPTIPLLSDQDELDQRRAKLAEYANHAMFAESGPREDIFPSKSLLNLVERHQSNLPSVVVLGDKGSGKSYTFMSLVFSQTWKQFSAFITPKADVQRDASILPVTAAQDLGDRARDRERSVTGNLANLVSQSSPLGDQQVIDIVEGQKRSPDSDSLSAWRNFWLDLLAWRCGHRVNQTGAFDTFLQSLASNMQVIAIFDGIETLFPRVRSSNSERVAVEALLRLVPDWLSQLPNRQIGCIIFIREDVARYALIENYNQFENRYSPYALKWNWQEASALALWVAQRAGALPPVPKASELVDLDEEARGRELGPLWGLKLGSDDSKEARSQEWVMSSLSDFNHRIKARDLVRFIYESAKKSFKQAGPRLLSARAMRDSIDPCSIERVKETRQESTELDEVFRTIEQLPNSDRELPWTLERAIRLVGTEATKTLDEGGVLFRDGDEYYVPEIYRHGLGFYYSRGARRKVVTLMRRALIT